MVVLSRNYKNARKGFLTDVLVDTTPVGSIVPNLKTTQNSYDNNFVFDGTSNYPKLGDISGNAYQNGDDPAYTHEGYLYCDGSEYYIKDFPALFAVIGTDYGGSSSQGADIVNPGQNYTNSPIIIIAPPTAVGGVQAQVGATIDIQTGKVASLTVLNPGSGYDYSNPPAISISGGGGSGLQIILRISPTGGGLAGINKFNVMQYWGDQYLGTFKVPDTIAKKIVGNGAVYGNNSPNIGNSTLGVGTTGGGWVLTKTLQDDYFSLGRISTAGYERVVETTDCDIIGSHTINITMRETKLSGAPQHSHTVYHSIPGSENWVGDSSGDRYLQDYRPGSGRLSRWYPTTGQVFTHKHGLLRQPNTDNTVATYDVFDYEGGAGGSGSLKDPNVPLSQQYYLASGANGAGSFEFQTFIPDPTFYNFTGASNIGGREVNTGGTPIYDYSDVWEFTTPGGPYSINFSNITGTPSVLQYIVVAGGGSGAAGTQQGNDGTDSILTIGDGSAINLTARGGKKGRGSIGLAGGLGGAGGTTASSGSEGSGSRNGFDGIAGQNGIQGNGWPAVSYPNNPSGGGIGGILGFGGVYGGGTNGVNVFVGGQSGTYNQTLNGDGTFNLSGVGNPISASFIIQGGRGGGARGGRSGSGGGYLSVELSSSSLSSMKTYQWSAKIGGAGTSGLTDNPSGGSASHSGSGGFGGEGHIDADGGGGGASTLLLRGTQIVAGAGGGGGAGADGYDGGAGQDGLGPPVGLQATTGALGAGAGGTGGAYGCVGGGGGGGGGGCAVNGLTFGGSGNGGASGGPCGGPGADGGHGGGAGANQGVSSYRSDIFSSGSLGTSGNTTGSVSISVNYNDDYWTSGGGGGGGGAVWDGNVNWNDLNSPAAATIYVGSGGSGVSMSGNTSGSTSSGQPGYAKVALGKIIGYEGGQTGVSIGDVVVAGSQSPTVWDIGIYSNGTGTGTAGNFKLPTTQVPTVYIVGGGGVGATATATVIANRVTGINLTNQGTGYTEVPYVYVMNGAGKTTTASATINAAAGTVENIVLTPGSSTAITHYLKFGGLPDGDSATRYAEIKAVDTTNVNYVSVKACRGNGVNGGNTPEEVVRIYYQLAGSGTWSLIDTIITPSAPRTDPIIGNVPAVSQAWDGASGDTKWYTYTVALPQAAKAPDTKLKLEQPRSTPSAANDNADDADHFGFAEIIYWREKVTQLVFVPSPGAISKPLVDELAYTIQGETGPSITYSSGLGATAATLTLAPTTKIEPVAKIDPDYAVPLLHPYRLCKYLIKAF